MNCKLLEISCGSLPFERVGLHRRRRQRISCGREGEKTVRSVTFYNFLLEAALGGSLLILLLLAARPLARRLAGNRAVYLAWLMVALRLLIPLSLPNPLMNELRPQLSSNYAARPIADQVRVRMLDAVFDVSHLVSGDDVTELNDNPLYRMGVSLAKGQLGQLALIVYLGGAGGALGVLAWRNLRFRRRLHRGRVSQLTPAERADYEALCRQMKVRPLPVWRVKEIPAPCLAGVLRWHIALPADLAQEDVELALRHELTHQRQGEPLWNLLRTLCCALHWFNPMVWLAASLSRADGELACDERLARSFTPGERSHYTHMLDMSRGRRSVPALGVQTTSMMMKRRRIALRQAQLGRETQPGKAGTVLWLALAIALGSLSFFTGEKTYAYGLTDDELLRSIPIVTERVQRRNLETPAEAEAWFRKLVESPFVQGEPTESPVVTEAEGGWQVRAGNVTAEFNREGVITAYRNGDLLSGTFKAVQPGSEDVSVSTAYAYLRAFADACLPDVVVDTATLVKDRIGSTGRFLTLEVGHSHSARAYSMVLQTAPRLRVASFELLDAPEWALVRTSTLEGANDQPPQLPSPTDLQRITMSQALEIARDQVRRHSNLGTSMGNIMARMGEQAGRPLWIVTFKQDGQVCYEVYIDALNGEPQRLIDALHHQVIRADADEAPKQANAMPKEQAIALARQAVAARYSFSEEESASFLVADTRYLLPGTVWLDYTVPVESWFVAFRMPDTDVAFISDYDVILDAVTGEVLRIFDPSNNANG